ncbi:hypothetical protein [Proteus columbae]|uniref:hypothetical protein n=1 Tax=Proteus columbae TaxID=1987580 RepID=UPI0018C74E51|nr:hypothetical protein [Proteus columbae]MBG6025832.1 hypothetical protein [Proteus mirabilis]MBG6046618.1 hypothetical protein [Proteus mirabilis]
MRVSANNENLIKRDNSITPSMADNSGLLFNKLSQARNSCKTFLIGDKKLKSKNIQLMCEELLQRVISKEECRGYELIEIETLPDMVSSRVPYSKYSKSMIELFNILENELKKVSGMEYFVLTKAQQKNVDKIKDTFSQISIQADKNFRKNSCLAINLTLIRRIEALGIDTLNNT